jgi:prepilin-type N-terminal cleavage/methylation domain-containing protein
MKTYSNSEKGFTLVELAVVMIIIGLLIGGVLKGQELIKSAKVTSTISQVKAIDAATSTFQDIYAGLPGDLLAADTRLPGCDTNSICAVGGTGGDGDGIVENATSFDPAGGTDEGGSFFIQLSRADLLSGVAEGSDNFGSNYPQAPVGGGFIVESLNVATDLPAPLATDASGFRAGLYVMHQQIVGDTSVAASSSLTMQRIDRKIDDGNPLTGSVMTVDNGGASNCIAQAGSPATTSNAYDTTNSSLLCNAMIRIQN